MGGPFGQDPAEAARRAASGEPRAIARIISALEEGAGWGEAAAREMERLAGTAAAAEGAASGAVGAAAPARRARVIGITGPPGAGKSTLADRLVALLRGRGKRVAVVAIDPSSPLTGGALLGDRIRMGSAHGDPGVFVRSMASRGMAGGLAPATGAVLRVLAAAGFEEIIVETAGVGQSEVDISRLADIVVVVAVPGLGDDIQAMKAGIMEIAEVFALNKSDLRGAERAALDIRGAFDADDEDAPEVIATIAETGEGVQALLEAIDRRFAARSGKGGGA